MACLKVSAFALMLAVGCVNASIELFNFNDLTSARSSVSTWSEQSDTSGVTISGQSKATIEILESESSRRAVFFALLNPVDERGFATMRLIESLEDLSGYTAFEINCRGQGEYTQFKITLRQNGLNTVEDTYFEASFQAPTQFSTVNVPFSAFQEYFQGQLVEEQTTFDFSSISSFGIKFYVRTANDIFQTGPATLEINWVTAV